MAIAVDHFDETARDAEPSALFDRVSGLLLAMTVPAIFWPLVMATVANAFGLQVSTLALVATGCAIALFLAAVCAPMMLRRPSAQF